MKICLYLEFYYFLNGLLFKKVGTGLLSSYRNQKEILDYLKIPYVEKWDDSCDVFQTNTPWLKSLYLMKKAKRRGMKVVVFSHVTAEDAMQVFWFMPLIAPLFKKYLKYAYDSADLILSPTEYTKSLVAGYGIKKEKIFVHSNGVNLDKFYADKNKRESAREKYGLKNLVVGTVGLVIPRKGIDIFLKLGKKNPNTRFMWFGKIYSAFLVKPLPKNIPVNVKFTGYVDDVLVAFNALDIFIFPSYEENQGMVILEAAAVGLPILVRDIPVYAGWLVNGENCLKAKNDEEFMENINRLLTDKQLREKLSQNAKILAQKESIRNLAGNIEAIYHKLLANK